MTSTLTCEICEMASARNCRSSSNFVFCRVRSWHFDSRDCIFLLSFIQSAINSSLGISKGWSPPPLPLEAPPPDDPLPVEKGAVKKDILVCLKSYRVFQKAKDLHFEGVS